MNRNVIFGIIGILILSFIISYKIYSNEKAELLEKNQRIIVLKNKIDKILYLQNKYKNIDLNKFKSICNIDNMGEKAILKCSNLNQNNFRMIQNYIFKANVKLNKFTIIKNKDKVNLSVELMK